MTALENYAQLINGIFGSGTATFNTTRHTTNNVIGALNNPTDYTAFKANFTARLHRLKNIYHTHPDYLQKILVQINEISSPKNWEGAFAELAAFDHLHQDYLGRKTFLLAPIQPDVTIDVARTFGLELGKSAANLDGHIPGRSLYFDVKCFKDNVTEILAGIYEEYKRHIGRTDVMIGAEYDLGISYEDFQARRSALLHELKSAIIVGETTFFGSAVVPNLNFRIRWGAGILTTERTYSPFEHAQNYHKTIFNYANKFVKDQHNIIILVVFPWYNLVVSGFREDNKKLYRALSRRVFCQYINDTNKFSTFASTFTGDQSIHEVAQHLSGIIFMEDDTILSIDPDKTNVKSFVYLNPNAVKPIRRSLASDLIMGMHNSDFDNFEHDNY